MRGISNFDSIVKLKTSTFYPFYSSPTTDAQSYVAIYNLLDFPAGVLPVIKVSREDDEALDAYSKKEGKRDALYSLAAWAQRGGVGLPVAVQLVGRPYEDEKVLSVMCQLEAALKPASGMRDLEYPLET